MPLYIAQSGDLDRCYRCLTHSQTLKDIATQLLIKYKSGALVTQFQKYIIIFDRPLFTPRPYSLHWRDRRASCNEADIH